MSEDRKRIEAIRASFPGWPDSRVRFLLAYIDKLEAALRFYANEETYEEINERGFPIDSDAGKKARQALGDE